MFGSITSSLFGDEPEAEVQNSALTDLLRNFPELQNVGEDLISRSTTLSNDRNPYIPAGVAPINQMQQRGLDMIQEYNPMRPDFKFGQQANDAYGMSSDLLNSVTPAAMQAQNYFAQGASPITNQEFTSAYNQFNDPYIDDVIAGVQRDIGRQRDEGLAYARGAASNAGAFGGDRQALMESEIMRNAGNTTADTTAGLRSGGFQQAVQNAMNMLNQGRSNALSAGVGSTNVANTYTSAGNAAAGLGGNLMNARQTVQNIQSQQLNDMLSKSNALIQGGGMGQQEQQNVMNRDAVMRQIPLQQLETLRKLFGTFPATGSGTGEMEGTEGFLSSDGNVGAGIANAVGLVGFSDRRLKENIQLIKKQGEYNIYEFNYKTDPEKRYRGVMAQEVEKIKPEAVVELCGWKAVNYDMINIQMEAL